MSKKVDWPKLKTEYVTTAITTRALADKYGVSYSALSKRAAKEAWSEARSEFGSNYEAEVQRKVVKETSDKTTELLSRELRIANRLSELIEEKITEGKYVSTNAIKEYANTIKILEQVKRSITGQNTDAQERTLKIAEQRLQMDKDRADKEENTDTNITVVFDGISDERWSE